MSEAPKFSFGAPASTGSSGSLFGGAPAQPSGSLFGQTSGDKPASLFASAPAAQNTGDKPSLFGSNNAASSGGSTFSFGSTAANTGSSLFGGGAKPASTPFTFGNSATPAAPPSSTPAGGLFGANANSQPATGTSLFGNNAAAKTDAASTTTGTSSNTTPAANKSSAIDFSTTPAGPPPQTAAATSLFGAKPATTGGLFGSTPAADANKPATSLFGAAPAAQSSSAPSDNNATTGSGLFGQNKDASAPAAATPSLFGQQPAAAKPDTAATSAPLFSLSKPTADVPAPAATGLFGKPASTEPAAAADGAAAKPSLFGAQPAATAPGTLFGKPAESKSDAPAASTSSTSLFGAKPATSTAPAPAAAAPATSLFGAPTKQPEAAKPTETAPANAANTTTSNPSALGASTSGPVPSNASRLATKSLDEILTLWTTSLTAHQKSFGNTATKISVWDRQLVENSDKISKLYARTFQAERDTAEVERQLTAVEGEQQELERYLNHYEKVVDDLMARNGTTEGGVDGERERTYRIAERCSSRLTTMSHDLTTMIDEINSASTNLRHSSKATNAQDPLGQIVRVLNGHLAQLQQIDAGSATLQAKVAAAQKEARGLGHSAGLGNDEVDAFARSYLGRR